MSLASGQDELLSGSLLGFWGVAGIQHLVDVCWLLGRCNPYVPSIALLSLPYPHATRVSGAGHEV